MAGSAAVAGHAAKTRKKKERKPVQSGNEASS